MPPKFFITHSWKDIEFARRLTDDLSARGLDGFFDAYSIQPGDNIPERIARGLETCDVYVPMLSPTAVASRWSELEINSNHIGTKSWASTHHSRDC
jgi:TIR domain.